jgi:hypothetical protein
MPLWMREAMKGDKKREDFLIAKPNGAPKSGPKKLGGRRRSGSYAIISLPTEMLVDFGDAKSRSAMSGFLRLLLPIYPIRCVLPNICPISRLVDIVRLLNFRALLFRLTPGAFRTALLGWHGRRLGFGPHGNSL